MHFLNNKADYSNSLFKFREEEEEEKEKVDLSSINLNKTLKFDFPSTFMHTYNFCECITVIFYF